MKKKILLTGASGFVGKNFLKTYQSEHDITPVSVRAQTLKDLNLKGFDCVIHCAALVHQMKGAPESQYFEVNYELTKTLARKALEAGVGHFVFISTAHVYGDSGDLFNHQARLSETTPCLPRDAYGRSKLKAEEFLQTLNSSDFCISIIRPPMVYGKGAKGNILALAKLVERVPLLPLGYAANRRSLIGIENLCYFISLVTKKRLPGVFLPQDKEPLSIKELVTSLASAMDRRILLFCLPNFVMHFIFKLAPKLSSRLFGTLALESETSNRNLGYTPQLSTRDGFKSMLS